jgi:hypothetical protein
MHSLIDVITNSSSELFVIHKRKSVNAVTEVLDDLIKVHNKAAERESDHVTFEGVFGNIKQIETEKEAIKAVADNSFWMLNDFSIGAQLSGRATDKLYEDGEVEKLVKTGEIDYKKHVKVGDILVHSADDDSIPGSIMDAIESMFDCQRIHLG